MKIRKYVIVSLVLCTILCSYKQEKISRINLNGKFINLASNEITLTANNEQKQFIVKTDTTGAFSLSIDIGNAHYFTLKAGITLELFLTPNDSIFVTDDIKDPVQTLKFTGNRPIANKYIQQRLRFDDVIYGKIYNGLYSFDKEKFLKTVDSLIKQEEVAYDLLSENKDSLNTEFLRLEKERINYCKASLLTNYSLNEPPDLIKRGYKDIKLTSGYFDFIKQLNINDSSLLQLIWFQRFIKRYILKQADEKFEEDSVFKYCDNILTNLKIDAILSTFHNQKIRDYLLHDILQEHIYVYGSLDAEKLLKKFKSNCRNENFVSDIDKSFSAKVQSVANLEKHVYKKCNNRELGIYIKKPIGWNNKDTRPAFVFFHGGGWSSGGIEEGLFFDVCNYFSTLGMVTMTVEYRTRDQDNSTPVESIEDAKSAIHWVRENAAELGIDSNKIIASGASAGAHLAACTGILTGFDEPAENAEFSSMPNALVLWSAPLDVTKDNWFRFLLKDKYPIEKCSPYQNIRKGLVPIIEFHGTEDNYVSFETVKEFSDATHKLGNEFELKVFSNKNHFILGRKDTRNESLKMATDFLIRHNYIKVTD